MYLYIYNSRRYQRCISIFITVCATRGVCIIVVLPEMYQYIYNSRCYQRCISIFITVGVTRDVSVYLK